MTYFIKVLCVFCLFATQVYAEAWVRGVLALHETSGKVALTELGQAVFEVVPEELPQSFSGLLECEVSQGASAFFSASNRMFILIGGAGSFSVERFEQIAPTAEMWQAGTEASEQSRVIMNFRSGSIVVDNRSMAENSQCLIETPLGRISVRQALWRMQVVYDPRSRIFDFMITCSDGRVRFTDLQGQSYTLRNGQRLSGAGTRGKPSIEVGEMSSDDQQHIRRFRALVDQYTEAANVLDRYLPGLKSINNMESAVYPQPTSQVRRPIVIEHAREPDPVTPFRGEVVPPSAYQADIF